MILNLETVFLIQISDHDTENLHFPGVGEEAARCEIFFCSSEFLFVKPHSLRQANHFLTQLQALKTFRVAQVCCPVVIQPRSDENIERYHAVVRLVRLEPDCFEIYLP